jgi:hypothetical protein
VNPKAESLDVKTAELFHTQVAKLLYLCKRARPDIHTAVAFLTTRVIKPDVDDYGKLRRVMQYLRNTRELPLTLEGVHGKVQWWVDASFAVHPDMRSHTGVIMSLGKGTAYSMSTRQKINTKSSTEAELVGVDDAMSSIVWTRNFLQAQGYNVTDNIVYQDNQSAMLLEKNGQASSGKRTRHIDIRYFFIKDRIANNELRIEYCPTDDMLSDILTKPLQGAKFRKFRDNILNVRSAIINHNSSHESQECVGASLPTSESNESNMTLDRRPDDSFQQRDDHMDEPDWIKVERKRSKRKQVNELR